MNFTTKMHLEIEIEVTGDFSAGCPEIGPNLDGPGHPAEPCEVDDITVTLRDKDITQYLSGEEIETIKDEYLEYCVNHRAEMREEYEERKAEFRGDI